MSDNVIKVENISKLYRLGSVGADTLKHDMTRWWNLIRGKENPDLKMGETNDRSQKGKSDLVWALKDITFEVKRGEVLGIIGKNGAGKSTLLKILSRVTAPTLGNVKIKGRISSLLEVGTGFHPELTGRENIFLNGAILGMTKSEIKSKFDEIVAFSGVERYIDTPVKRYSSGMYVRLAFGVAAHLNPEILIVDEVLAVGDVEFQKKCLGKMKDAGENGKTVLFVSHNMPVVRQLCNNVVWLDKGEIVCMGNKDDVISKYLSSCYIENDISGNVENEISAREPGTYEAKFKSISLFNHENQNVTEINFLEYFNVELVLECYKNLEDVVVGLFISNVYSEKIMMTSLNEEFRPLRLKKGTYKFNIQIKEHLLPGQYLLGMGIFYFYGGQNIDYIQPFYPFRVNAYSLKKNMDYPWPTVHGYIYPEATWNIEYKN